MEAFAVRVRHVLERSDPKLQHHGNMIVVLLSMTRVELEKSRS